MQRRLAGGLTKHGGEPAFRKPDNIRHLGNRHTVIATLFDLGKKLVQLRLRQPAIHLLRRMAGNIQQAGNDAADETFRIDRMFRGLRQLIDKQAGKSFHRADILYLDRAAQRRHRRRTADRR
ncbi:hypothetical protein D3C87_1365590 [compost metagenome]